METRDCPKCGGRMYHNKEISKKNNKPYENWKCICGNIEWVDIKSGSGGNNEVLDKLADIGLKLDFIIAEINERKAKNKQD